MRQRGWDECAVSQQAWPPVSRANRQRRVGEPSVKALRVRIQTLMADREQRTRRAGGRKLLCGGVCACVFENVNACDVSLAWRGSQEATHQGPESRGNLTLAIRESGLTKPALSRHRGQLAARSHFEADAGSSACRFARRRWYPTTYVGGRAGPSSENLSE